MAAPVPASEIPAPILTTPRLLIRPYHPSDAAPSQRAADSPAITQYMTNAFPSPYTLADANAWIAIASTPTVPPASPSSPAMLLQFAILVYDDDGSTSADGSSGGSRAATFAGGIGLKPHADVEARTMEVGYWIAEAYWGRGLATEAVAAFARWSFGAVPGLGRLEAGVFEGNEASARVLRKAGFVCEGARRKTAEKKGRVFDIGVWGLLKEECLEAE
ncbi:hypothetical protein NKR23_g8069 [Pleurostoma richardsiae]|uniref:N-acetyltransferase domain-containing protein n=1 Tax=Pleurostoma richardsiae TaxID=41990 RepID=A0AA38VLQ3_9PEZI|nr:hypothetical protein NKR23_g8069 [Pleurostoma richardsiae]